MIHAKITSKGQVTLPAEMRTKMRLNSGDRIVFEEQTDGSFIIRKKTVDIRELRGIVKYSGPPVSVEDMDRAVQDAVAEEYRRSIS